MNNEHVDEFLAHYGVKGMKWGVRRNRRQLRSRISQEGNRVGWAEMKAALSGGKKQGLSKAKIRAINKAHEEVMSGPRAGKIARNIRSQVTQIQNQMIKDPKWADVKFNTPLHKLSSSSLEGKFMKTYDRKVTTAVNKVLSDTMQLPKGSASVRLESNNGALTYDFDPKNKVR